MATVLGDICFPVGKYVKDGEEKTRWAKAGVLLQTDNGIRGKLDMVPVASGEDGGWFSVFERDTNRTQQAKPAQNRSESATPKDDQDDIPF